MPFDSSKDIVLRKWKCSKTGLVITINKYNDGEAKVQIGPRILKKNDGSDRAPTKTGRLNVEDILWLYENIDEIKDELLDIEKPALL